jgi:hypothetical protein
MLTDVMGQYQLKALSAGQHTILVYTDDGVPLGYKVITLGPRQHLSAVDITIEARGDISGHISDDSGEGVGGITVFLVSRDYGFGTLRYSFPSVTKSDTQGNYRITDVYPQRVYFVLAKRIEREIDAHADQPTTLEKRTPIQSPTYYPHSPSIEAADPIVLSTGEERSGVDIRLTPTHSYCIQGSLNTGRQPAPRPFEVDDSEPGFELEGGGGVRLRPPRAISGPDGKFRVCG